MCSWSLESGAVGAQSWAVGGSVRPRALPCGRPASQVLSVPAGAGAPGGPASPSEDRQASARLWFLRHWLVNPSLCLLGKPRGHVTLLAQGAERRSGEGELALARRQIPVARALLTSRHHWLGQGSSSRRFPPPPQHLCVRPGSPSRF